MAEIKFNFDVEKAVESILYLAYRVSSPTYMLIAKLLYFADKTSLEEYGRFITGDTYVAMKHGPVPSETYNLMKAGNDGDQYGFTVENNHHIKPLRDANTDLLSDSDIICLDKILKAYAHFPTWYIREISHDDLWEEFWEKATEQGKASTPIPVEKIVETFDDADDLKDFLLHRHDD